jgi:putative membrane protein
MSAALFAYLHFLGVIALFATLFAERLLFLPGLSLAEQRRLVMVDLSYGAAATLVLVTGLVRVFTSAKGTAFYFGNPAFHAMGALFLVAALLSLYPTRRFVTRWRALRAGDVAVFDARVSVRISRVINIELALLLLALGLAVLMARGIGADWLS